MTRNQIEYLKYRENVRSNLVSEALTRSRDENAYRVNLGQLNESQRHNLATENLNRMSLDESARHNQATEAYYNSNLLETVRSNIARESETNRHNVALETEQSRSNLMSEALRAQELASLDTYRSQQIGLGYSQLSESVRHNTSVETETKRSNKEHEVITNRSNLLNYSLQAERNSDARIQNQIANSQRDTEIHLEARRDTINAASKIIGGIASTAKVLVPLYGSY